MAVPIQVVQEKKASPESPKPSTSETEPSAEYNTPGNGAQDSLKKLTSHWYQAKSEDEFPPKTLRRKAELQFLKVAVSQFWQRAVWVLPISKFQFFPKN